MGAVSCHGEDENFVIYEATAASHPFLTGFVADEKTSEVYGRPVSVQTRDDGAIFVVDDAGDTVWMVRHTP